VTQTSNTNANTQWNQQQQPTNFGNNFLFSTPNSNEAAFINRTQTTVTTSGIPASQTQFLNLNNGTSINTVPVVSNTPGIIN
jgi:hypothetical protein